MKRLNGIQIYLIIIILGGLIGTVLSGAWPVRAGLMIIAVVSGYAYYHYGRSRLVEQAQQRLNQQKSENHLNTLQIINRLRHDWMNDIQVLFGYIQLKKYDNLPPYMEKIRMSMQHESFLSKLGIPALISYIFKFRAEAKDIQLEIGLDREISLQNIPVQADLIFNLVYDTVELFNEQAMPEFENIGVLSLEFDVGEDHLLLDFVYQGPYNREGLEEAVRDRFLRDSGNFVLDTHDYQEEEVVIGLRLPYRT
jgi:stage 0 sporulation protein B (sporulation initiation phosphotransferase)